MTLAFFVYLGLMLALIAAWVRPARMVAGGMSRPAVSAINWATMISITLFTLLIGGRYNVGGDFVNYLDMYRFTTVGASSQDAFVEPGFLLLMQFLKLLGMPERSVIVASSLIQIILLSLWLRKHAQIAPFALFGFTTLLLLDVNNIIRQGIAFFAILLAISAVNDRRWVKFLAWGLFAYMFHKSALLVIPICFIIRWCPLAKVQLQAIALILSYLFVGLFFDSIVGLFTTLAELFGYSAYSNISRSDLIFTQSESTFNIGIYFWPLVDITIILFSSKMNNHYKFFYYRTYHNFYLVAAILQPVANAWDFIPFARGLFYFVAMRSICVGFLLHYCLMVSGKPRDVVIAISMGAAFLTWFVVAISRGAAWSAPYQFY
jgi:hypothetical protein